MEAEADFVDSVYSARHSIEQGNRGLDGGGGVYSEYALALAIPQCRHSVAVSPQHQPILAF